ncbi:MAG: HAMP domain-containing protein [Spirochaetaceae bacterium]|jgi:class 3 adenylate cyclase/HAMP domain-containing protein|nr:HAMP domain-containing protein [Spirochaetaceae bacterium]
MSIRSKIILVVLPLIVVTLVLAGTASYFAAAKGITRITQRFFDFKVNELRKYTESQWALLVENDYSSRPDMVLAAENAVEVYSRSIILSDTELIFALNGEGTVVMATAEFSLSEAESAALRGLLEEADDDLLSASIGGSERVIRAFYFTPFQWWILLTEETAAFYRDVNSITLRTLILTGAASVAAVLLLFFFAKLLTAPLGKVVKTMEGITGSTDLSARVEVEYQDETGQLAHTFNLMISELEKAYTQIKHYAFDAVLARKKEQRIRQIFQKYVPKDLIDKFFSAPESMLVGDNRELAVLFSDIRSFTTISEGMAPDDLVNSLNRYFSGQVDIIMNRNGIVDKYIGDAIMAFWGAPVKHDDDALQSVLSALDMIDALKTFNETQRSLGKPEFRIGVGINYGTVTVGNIGSERKMDYTVIGDMVNLASRMEGLTKPYRQDTLISETIYGEIQGRLPTRLLDTVAVKGKTRGVKIYTVKRSLAGSEERAWAVHNEGMEAYYRRSFGEAAAKFQEVLSLLPDDFIARVLLGRCKNYTLAPPPEGWDGVEVMKTK